MCKSYYETRTLLLKCSFFLSIILPIVFFRNCFRDKGQFNPIRPLKHKALFFLILSVICTILSLLMMYELTPTKKLNWCTMITMIILFRSLPSFIRSIDSKAICFWKSTDCEGINSINWCESSVSIALFSTIAILITFVVQFFEYYAELYNFLPSFRFALEQADSYDGL